MPYEFNQVPARVSILRKATPNTLSSSASPIVIRDCSCFQSLRCSGAETSLMVCACQQMQVLSILRLKSREIRILPVAEIYRNLTSKHIPLQVLKSVVIG